ncbi:MAG: PspC domain-containing protein [Pseudomonadales bacterium]|nr:PspC domain-containing protein [Pseudomonadales bacterium]MBO6565286.1 PspC domain-containing protein [Pseudomonadales bacterium]MBO6595696.1 PspC domain-containing protein [Pseudomonadales bacterium]MBO6820746.1 PspC domain-containing protein [Pseudomonadales bacterium]
MSRDRRDAERAARRARRLAERAEERARRKERQAERAAERADRLAERASKRPSREKELDKSIEDLVDEVTQKAEAWIDELIDTGGLGDDRDVERADKQAKRAQREADKARASADRAEQAADEVSISVDDEFVDYEPSPRRSRKSNRKSRRRRYGYGRFGASWRRARRRRTAHLYRDREHKKILGVCAGIADHFGRPSWEIRLYAVLGMVFIPQIVFPAYFVTYFFMDEKPYYRRVTDRFDDETERFYGERDDLRTEHSGKRSRESSDNRSGASKMAGKRARGAGQESKMSNVQAMKTARDKFSEIEQRLREMETHVTSSRFELQRELKKISGED